MYRKHANEDRLQLQIIGIYESVKWQNRQVPTFVHTPQPHHTTLFRGVILSPHCGCGVVWCGVVCLVFGRRLVLVGHRKNPVDTDFDELQKRSPVGTVVGVGVGSVTFAPAAPLVRHEPVAVAPLAPARRPPRHHSISITHSTSISSQQPTDVIGRVVQAHAPRHR